MQIDERSFFQEVSDDFWLFQRILHLRACYPDPDISFVEVEERAALPRSLAVGYALYLAMVAKRTKLSETIWETFPEAQTGIVRNEYLIFRCQGQELRIAVIGLFKCCPLIQLEQWFTEILRTIATPRHLPLFTTDVLLAIDDEATLTLLFRRLPLLWLPTSPTMIVSLSTEKSAYRVAKRHHRLLAALPDPQ